MKKLVMMAAAVAFGCVAQAAICSWGTEMIVADNGGTDVAVSSGNWWLITLNGKDISGVTWNPTDGLKIADGMEYTYFNILGSDPMEFTDQQFGFTFGSEDTETDPLTPANNGDKYALVLVNDTNDKYAIVEGEIAGIALEPAPADGSMTFKNATGTGAFAGQDVIRLEAVPEPTSGLLLLLGVAGLALRRRRA